MTKAEVKAVAGKKAQLVMNGKELKGSWEVTVVGVVENNPRFKNHAKVMWQKPATSFNAADTKPESHYVPLGSLQPTKAQEKARKEVAKAKAEKKVAQPKGADFTKGLTPSELVKLADALKTLDSLGFDVTSIQM